MAAADPWARLMEEATCSICSELYTDPVTLDCGHNFCLSCFNTFKRKEDLEKACPECKQHFDQGKEMKPNKRLANMVEMVKELQIAPGSLCKEHGERLQLFCETDGELLCVFCRESQAHREHRVTLVIKAEQEYKGKLQDWLCPLRKEVEYILESKHKEEEEYHTMRNKMQAEKQKIVTEIERLHQLLRDEEKTLYGRLEKMEETINMVENANINKLSNEIDSLQALITEIEKRCKESALDLLKDVRSTLDRCTEVTFQCPELERKEKETNIQFVKTPKNEEKIKKYEGLELRLILVGSEGAGKSRTGNSLLGREEFETRDSGWFVTEECQRGEGQWGGRPLVVVDTPGLLSPLFTPEELPLEMQRGAQLSAPGPHALLLVLQIGRFSWVELESAQTIPLLFGAEALRFTVLVFTGKEQLRRGTIETFVRDDEHLKELVQLCGGRLCAFNTRATGAERERQVRGLMRVIDKMMEGNGSRYLRLRQDQETPGQDRPFKAI